MNKRFVSVVLLVAVLLGATSLLAYAGTYTTTASQVSFWNPVPNSDANWARANVPCSGSSKFKLSSSLPTWPFNPANWSVQWCRNNVVQMGIPSAFVAYVYAGSSVICGSLGPACMYLYQNRSAWRVTYTR
jgi:hypothetical protein